MTAEQIKRCLESIHIFLIERGDGKCQCTLTWDEFNDIHKKLCEIIESLPDGKEWKWLNGDNYEYEYAYCSRCGHMEWASWDSHAEAKEKVRGFHETHKFCSNCGAKMVGGEYREIRRRKS